MSLVKQILLISLISLTATAGIAVELPITDPKLTKFQVLEKKFNETGEYITMTQVVMWGEQCSTVFAKAPNNVHPMSMWLYVEKKPIYSNDPSQSKKNYDSNPNYEYRPLLALTNSDFRSYESEVESYSGELNATNHSIKMSIYAMDKVSIEQKFELKRIGESIVIKDTVINSSEESVYCYTYCWPKTNK